MAARESASRSGALRDGRQGRRAEPLEHPSGAPRAALGGCVIRRDFARLVVIDVLAEHNAYPVDVAHTEFANPIRLICWLRSNVGASIDHFPEVRIDVLDPLEQVNALRALIASNKMNGGVIAPDNGVCFVAEVPGKTQHIAVERCRRLDVRDMQYGRTLNKLNGIGRR